MSQERKTIAVNKELADRLAEIAKEEGMTLYSLINEVLESAVYCHDAKLGKCSEVVSTFQNLMIAKDIRMSFIPLKLVNLVHKLAFESEGGKEELIREWHEYGRWIANYAKVRFPTNELQTIEKVSLNVFWQNTEFQFKKIPNAANPKEIEIKILGHELELEYVECICSIYEGMFNGFNYETMKKEVSEGVAFLKLKRKE